MTGVAAASSTKASSEAAASSSVAAASASASSARAASQSVAAAQSASAASKQQQTAQASQSSQSGSSISTDEHTLTGFVNKYGESPVAYKVDHGMSQKGALASTPDGMCSSGEIQLKHVLEIE